MNEIVMDSFETHKALQNGIASDNQDSFNSPIDQKCIFRGKTTVPHLSIKFFCMKHLHSWANVIPSLKRITCWRCPLLYSCWKVRRSVFKFQSSRHWSIFCDSYKPFHLEKLKEIEKFEDKEKLQQKSKANIEILNKLRSSGTISKLKPA